MTMATWRSGVFLGAVVAAACGCGANEDPDVGLHTAETSARCGRWSAGDPCEPRKKLTDEGGIPGEDDRIDLYCLAKPQCEEDDRTKILEVARASMAIFRDVDLDWDDGKIRIDADIRPLDQTIEQGYPRYKVCADEVFAAQPRGAWCSGVVIEGPRLLSVEHCLVGADVLFVRNFVMRDATNPATFEFSPQEVCRPRPGAIPECRGKACFVDIECEGPPPKAAKIAREGPSEEADVYVIGYPARLPAKFSGWAEVKSVEGSEFTVRAGLMGGNSGSPVFNAEHEVVGVINSVPSEDFCPDRDAGCRRWRACPGCDDAIAITVTRITIEQEP